MPETTIIRKDIKTQTLPSGQEVYVVTEAQMKESNAVEVIMKKANLLHEVTAKTKKEIIEIIDPLLDECAKKFGKKWKGNATLRTIDDSMKVNVSVSVSIKFNKDMGIAKQYYNEWISDEDAGETAKKLITRTFRLDNEGNIAKSKLLELYHFRSDHPKKKEADKILESAMRKEIRKPYITAFVKIDENNWDRIQLNFSEI